jgi:hypothetical protein
MIQTALTNGIRVLARGRCLGIASPYKILYKTEHAFYNYAIATECGSDWRGFGWTKKKIIGK